MYYVEKGLFAINCMERKVLGMAQQFSQKLEYLPNQIQ